MAGETIKIAKRSAFGRKRRGKRRIPARTDMTAMVDIVMLMLIFYMVTAVFMMPQAMEVNNPEETKDPPIVPWSKLLTIRIDEMDRFFWNVGDPAVRTPQLIPSGIAGTKYRVDSDSLGRILRNLNESQPMLNTLVLIRFNARYNAMVDLLDEIECVEREWNVQKAAELGKPVEQLSRDKKFSYRYAIGDWKETDDRIVAEALASAGEGR